MKFRLKEVSVENLFGNLSYSLRFSADNAVTAIIGANGVGKTTVMKMIVDAAKLPKVPSESFLYGESLFDSFVIVFVDDNLSELSFFYQTIVLKSGLHKLDSVDVHYQSSDNVVFSKPLKMTKPRDIPSILSGIKRSTSADKMRLGLHGIFENAEFHLEFLSASRIESDASRENEDQYLTDILEASNLSLIQSEKLLTDFRTENSSIQISRSLAKRLEGNKTSLENLANSDKFRSPYNSYQFVLGCFYFFKTFSLDGLQGRVEIYQEKKLLNKDLGDKLLRMIKDGFDSAKEFAGPDFESFFKMASRGIEDRTLLRNASIHNSYFSRGKIVSIFATRFGTIPFVAAASLFDIDICELALEKIATLFTDPFRVVTPTKIIFSPERGFEALVGASEDPISIRSLSSGQLNLLVVFYTLYFNQHDEILFIDEPENSLHVVWQEHYLASLIEAARGKNVQIIVATHSPFIIEGHDEITERIKLTYNV
jgi:ABC-type lipoprotein export system ATPase subunit